MSGERASLTARALAFGYRGRPVGRDANLTLDPGEVVCLLGPNGGGKTTLFKTLLGLLAPLAGEVALGGTDLRRLPRAAIARGVAYVPQAAVGYFPFTVRDIVLMGRTAHLSAFASPTRADREQADAALARLGIERLAAQPWTRISGGERQLALIARALAQAAPLLVMDEPTASLDFGNQTRVLGEVTKLAADGIGVLLSTHDPDHAFRCADRVVLIRDGTILAAGPVRATLTAAALHGLYGVGVRIADVPGAPAGTVDTVCLPLDAQPARREERAGGL